MRRFAFPLVAVGLSIFAYTTLVRLQGVDWNGLLQRISVLVVWLGTFSIFRALRHPRPRAQYRLSSLVMIFAATIAVYCGIQFGRPAVNTALRHRAPGIALLIERYADYDPSFGVAGEILAPTTADVFEASAADPFFAMLRENTNIPPEVRVAPVDIKMVDPLRTTTQVKPNIFIFVIDSLRQDYLSPYNPQVRFTPEIDDLAHDSIVMKNAFTRDGGTALAEAVREIPNTNSQSGTIAQLYSLLFSR